ncbi:Carbamate kinase [Melioribacter roseus P3M-2]|uniref:Carbamate kinase n=1 Tax=Melioribacter roseus (strain DSM 23840 / JCM 17771 / VKM B-2668 / P3M-2) TaxID=1191523 RepID=I6Z2Q1_MELRP|nr:carbamate kinase [Melioribacter roseus]AFN73395.1 Carbamate kinase [Melioribacter roseus P3M-2]
MNKIAVVALGGNALLRGDETGTIEQQEKHTLETCEKLIGLLRNGYNLVLTHGNGPQVGNILLRNEAGYNQFNIPKMPLDICVADSQGGIGYMIERQMRNAMSKTDIQRNVLAIITQVLIDINDPAFQNPTKPIGRFYSKEEADDLSARKGWIFKEDSAKRGWRRVVPSPKPVDIMNKQVIKEMVERGHIVIGVGGGGIPVYWHQDTKYLEAIEAVIDKDLASGLLASEIKADRFYIITDVPKVYINYKKENQKQLDKLTVTEAKKLYDEGQFPPGSMGPKILAAIQFVEKTGNEAVITNEEEIEKENCGTRIIPS